MQLTAAQSNVILAEGLMYERRLLRVWLRVRSYLVLKTEPCGREVEVASHLPQSRSVLVTLDCRASLPCIFFDTKQALQVADQPTK